MAILKVAQIGHPILRCVAAPIPVDQINSEPVQRLISDMKETMEEYDGAGLAAPQVHSLVRLVILELDDEQRVLINPVIEELTDEVRISYEGCLSVEGMRARVPRCAHIRLTAFNEYGEPFSQECTDFDATVVQHECDHLDGVLYVDRMDPRTLAFIEEYRRYGPMHRYWEDDEDGEE